MTTRAEASDPKGDDISVRSRRTVGPDGTRFELNVPCPEQGIDVALDVCGRCSRCEGLHVEPGGQAVTVTCRRKVPDDGFPPGELAALVGERGDARHTPVSEIMTTHVVCLRPDLGMASLGSLLLAMDVSGAPVVDELGRPLGVLSQSDVLEWLYSRGASDGTADHETTVADIMRAPVLYLQSNDSIAKAAACMAFEGIHRMPVVGTRGQVIGMVSPLDILRWLAIDDGYVLDRRGKAPRAR